MAHIKITNGPEPGTTSVVVDGVEMNRHILSEGFAVHFPENPEGEAHVSMKIAADVLEVDLPDAAVRAMRAPAEVVPERAVDSDEGAFDEFIRSTHSAITVLRREVNSLKAEQKQKRRWFA